MPRDRHVKQSLGTLSFKIKEARVLLVGAGGIGCELLKNLALTGFGEIHIVDLDTIDLSNLNRQFLFRHEHIKKSKALVAKESAAKFNPHIKLEAYHANIKDPQFDVNWFQTFNLVFNALDNLDARRHVNKMCLAAEVPLIESGTTGFNGQVQVIVKGKTECYDCNTKEVPKTFPVCTIRSTPSQPIHCIVWAKSYLFTEIFGVGEDEAPDLDHSEDSENALELENLRKEAQALKNIRQRIGSDDFPQKIFEKVFTDDIHRLRSMEEMWKTRKAPLALDYVSLSERALQIDASTSKLDQRIWTLEENLAVFSDSVRRMSARLQKAQSLQPSSKAAPVITFDKDDEDTLDFVTATANLRSEIFGIELKSKFDVKQMAGNIIPAIATTNAMTAGLCVLQAFKILRDDLSKAKMLYLERSGARAFNSDNLNPPSPACAVCNVTQSKLDVDFEKATLGNIVKDVLQKHLDYKENFSITNDVGILYDPDLDDNLPNKLSELGIKAGNFLTIIDDEDENPRADLSLLLSEKTSTPECDPVHLVTKPVIPFKPKIAEPPAPSTDVTTTNGHPHPEASLNGNKRKRDIEEIAEPEHESKASKRGRLEINGNGINHDNNDDDDAVLIDDNNDGAIIIDDD